LDELVDDLKNEWGQHDTHKKEGNMSKQQKDIAPPIKCDLKADGTESLKQLKTIVQPIKHAAVPLEEASTRFETQQQPKTCGTVPWNLEWLSALPTFNKKGIVLSPTVSAEKVMVKDVFKEQSCDVSASLLPKQKKEGVTKRSVGFIKRVARMPANDRKEILKILKKHDKSRKIRKGKHISSDTGKETSDSSKNSSSSVNKDWENWVVLNGKPNAKADDVQDIGKAVGVSFKCDTSNSFNLLTKEGRKGWQAASGVEVGNEGALLCDGNGAGC
jgi:hypothetical protein